MYPQLCTNADFVELIGGILNINKMKVICMLIQAVIGLQLVPEYEQGLTVYYNRTIADLINDVAFSKTFTQVPKIVLSWFFIDMRAGIQSQSTKVSSIGKNGFRLTASSLHGFFQLRVIWMAFLDDNLFVQSGELSQIITSSQVYIDIPFLNVLSEIPSAAFFMNGVTQLQTSNSSTYLYSFQISAVSKTRLQIFIKQDIGYGISWFSYNIIYGLAKYLLVGSTEFTILGSFQLFTADNRTKVSQIGINELSGLNAIRMNLTNNSGSIKSNTWMDSVIEKYILAYFNYMPCPLYCTSCYAAVPNCDSCIVSTYRIGSACTQCQAHMFILAGHMNCQQCSSYCNECLVSASNCTQCNPITFRINPPSCGQCPMMMYIVSDQQDCQYCGIYCGSCIGSADNCITCLAGTYRITPPNCMICQSQYYQDINIVNCQSCANYCNECTSKAQTCSTCLSSSLRMNPPSCTTCPSQYYVVQNIQNCQQCPTSCNNCQNFTSLCIACNPNFLRINPPNCIDCPQYSYVSGDTCTKCDQSCQTCNSTTCLSCLPQQYIDTYGKCINCPQHCLTCDNNTCYTCRGNCLQCNLTSCLKCISDSYYIQGVDCHPCAQNCSTCNDRQCLTCIANRKLINNQCECQFPCKECNSYQCLNCTSVNYRIQNQTCEFCPSHCVACDSLGNCYSKPENCQIGIYIDSTHIQCSNCMPNHYLYDNVCTKCAQQCLECEKQSYNCTLCRFPQFANKECVLCESVPGLYSDYLTNKCYSLCGDTIINGTEECDDGNDISLDGCSNCQIDPGYSCKGAICERIIYPVPQIYQNLTQDTVYDAYKYFLLSYNIPITSQAMNIKLQIQNITYTSLNISYINRQLFTLSLELSEEITDGVLSVIFINNREIISDQGFPQTIQQIECSISPYLVLNSLDQEISDSTNIVMQYILILLAVIILSFILFGGLELLWNLLDLLQTISYLKYINTIKPYNLYAFFNLFGFLQFQNLPINGLFNIQGYVLNVVDINQFQQVPKLISNDGYTSSIIINIIPVIIVVFMGVMVYLIAIMTLILFKRTWTVSCFDTDYQSINIKCTRFFYKGITYVVNSCISITKQWKWSGLIRLFTSSDYEIAFAICLGIYGIRVNDYGLLITFDFSITLLSILSYLLITFLISNVGNFKTITLRVKENEYSAVYEGLQLKNLMAKQYNTMLLIKKFLFMLFLVLLYNEPLFQILNIIGTQVTQVIYLIIINPIKDNKEQFKQIFCELFLLIAEISLLLLIVQDYSSFFIDDYRVYFAWICIFALIIIIVIQLLFDAHQQFIQCYKMYPYKNSKIQLRRDPSDKTRDSVQLYDIQKINVYTNMILIIQIQEYLQNKTILLHQRISRQYEQGSSTS